MFLGDFAMILLYDYVMLCLDAINCIIYVDCLSYFGCTIVCMKLSWGADGLVCSTIAMPLVYFL